MNDHRLTLGKELFGKMSYIGCPRLMTKGNVGGVTSIGEAIPETVGAAYGNDLSSPP